MNILLAFTPFIVFALIDRLIGSTEGLIAGALVLALVGAVKFTGWYPERMSKARTARHRPN